MKNTSWFSTVKENPWNMQTRELSSQKGRLFLETTGETDQVMEGFGACFNELPWIALNHAKEEEKNKLMQQLFGSEELDFSFCRMPIGANDYSEGWYSHNETPNDFAMEHFSIERDRKGFH